MKRILKKIIGVFFLIEFIMGIFLSLTELKEYPFAALFTCSFFGVAAFLLLRPQKKKDITQQSVPGIQSDIVLPTYIETQNRIDRIDGQPISDEEIPYLIEIGKQNALKTYEQSENPKFHRSEREENLSIQFMMNHSNEIQRHTNSFEESYRAAYSENDLNKKIELLQETIDLYEKEKKWFYHTKGGMIYFQDFYEHLHNSRNDDFSYIDPVKEYLKDCINKRDYIIPEIMNLITSSNGILQKDIYKYFPDMSKSKIQKTIRELEIENLITRTKKSNSYFLTLT